MSMRTLLTRIGWAFARYFALDTTAEEQRLERKRQVNENLRLHEAVKDARKAAASMRSQCEELHDEMEAALHPE